MELLAIPQEPQKGVVPSRSWLSSDSLQHAPKLAKSAVQVLKAQYDASLDPSSGFSVHPLLVPLVNELGDEGESWPRINYFTTRERQTNRCCYSPRHAS